MSVVEYRDRFPLSRYAPDETDTNEKRKERFLNGLHDEMQTVLVNIPFADLEALVDSAIQMEGKLHQANENRKRRMMNQSGPHHTQKHRNNSSRGFTPRNNRQPTQTYRPNYSNNHGGPRSPEATTITTATPTATTTMGTTPTPTLAQELELIFDNYTSIPGPSEVFPSSLPKKFSVPVNFVDDSASKELTEELKELRGQLQSVKKQSLMLMEQSRESSEREKIALQQAQTAIAEKDSAVAEAAAATSRENSMLQLLIDASLDMAGAFLDTATEDERVEARSNVLLRLAREHGSTFWGTPERTRQIVRFQDRALQVREYLDFCTRTLSLVYGTMFPRNKMPETLPALMDKFRDAPRIHGFVRAQLAAGARFAMIMIKICYPKLDVGQIVPKCLEKMSKRKRNFGKYDDIVTPVAEDMMDELLRMDSEFFVKGSYAEHSTRAVNNERLTIDNILGNP
ncbi:hypothetical protein QYE76_042500 [Lolium multiflorum]|uniref:Uncharacterized protein n=1 Tax=Lolium multiflorum TaxID=4521 RepID=A0AAD8TH21_LOLMU|nr:hypothetical protein QYE76_042500 [Lolium multiflorum]